MINLDDTKAFDRIADALERIADAETRGAELSEKVVQRTGAEPAGIPILLIVEVLIALIKIFRRLNVDMIEDAKLHALSRKLEPYQPVRPAGKEAE